MIASAAFGLFADAATRIAGRPLSILMFHRVVEYPDPLFPDEMHARRFDALLGRLKRYWHFAPLRAAIGQIREGSLKRRSLAITFDDGYADNAEIAAPILRKHGVSATVFVTTGYLGGGRMWNDTVIEAIRGTTRTRLQLSFLDDAILPLATIPDRRRAIGRIIGAIKHTGFAARTAACEELAHICGAALPDHLMMQPEQVRQIADNGIDIGAHTISHPILACLDDTEAVREIRQGKAEIEAIAGRPAPLFAYPNGRPTDDYLPRHVDMVRAAGFEAAVTTAWGACDSDCDPFQLPRFTPWDEGLFWFNARMVKNLFSGGPTAPAR